MARNDTLTVPAGQWTLLTNANVTSCRFFNVGSGEILVQATQGTSPPSSFGGAIPFTHSMGDTRSLAELFPGVAGANRLWAWCAINGTVSVSHA